MTKTYFTYGTPKVNEFKVVDFKLINFNNKIDGGMWGCPYNDYYSDWFTLTLMIPFLVSDDINVVGVKYVLDNDNYNILELTTNNYTDYMIGNTLNIDKIKGYDAIIYADDLVNTIKEFESYYFESVQIFNSECMRNIEKVAIDPKHVLTPKFKEYTFNIFENVRKKVAKTDIFKMLNENK